MSSIPTMEKAIYVHAGTALLAASLVGRISDHWNIPRWLHLSSTHRKKFCLVFLPTLGHDSRYQRSVRPGQRKSFVDVASDARPHHPVLVRRSISCEVNKMKEVGDLLRKFGTEPIRCVHGDNRRYDKDLLGVLASDGIQQCMTDHTGSGDNGFRNDQGIDIIVNLLFVAPNDRRSLESLPIRFLCSWVKSGL